MPTDSATEGGVGVVLMAYGTPATPRDVEPYYAHIRRGRPPAPELVADLRRRYEAIGGVSPLAERTRAQVDGVRAALDDAEPGRYRVVFGAKHAPPFIEDAAAELVAAGVRDVVALVLAPHYSALSVGEYFARLATAFEDADRPVSVTYIRDWHGEAVLVELLSERVQAALARFPPGARVETLFTAHSLPERILTMGDPYVDQLRETATAVAAASGLASWRVAWQSAGRTPEPWLGPDLVTVVEGLPGEGFDGIVVCPAGFVSDHLEVLYDVDIEARAAAERVGLHLERTASLNDDERLVALLAALVRAAAP